MTMQTNMRPQRPELDEVASGPSDEGQPEATDVTMDGYSRRTFLGVMGASAAFAGVGLSGCIRKPVTKIVPYATRPEDVVEGVPLHFATAYQQGADVHGVIVESHEGRPTKLEGNPAHPGSLGATNATTQASVLGLYDLDRSTTPLQKGASIDWTAAWEAFDKLAANKAQGLAIVLPAVMSPSARRLLATAKTTFPKARFFLADQLWPANAMAAAAAVAGDGAYALSHLDRADVVASFDCDFLGTEPGNVRLTKGFTQKRRIAKPGDPMSRLYVAEPHFSSTGAMADHRLRIKGGDVGKALGTLASLLVAEGVTLGSGLANVLPKATFDDKSTKVLTALAKDLAKNRGAGIIVVGYRQPAWVHALAFALNQALGAVSDNGPQTWHQDATLPVLEDLAALSAGLDQKAFETVLVLDADPVFAAAGKLGLAQKLAGVTNLVHAGTHADATGKIAGLHLPASHYLETWGDLLSLEGALSIQQPLIEPLHHTPSPLEVLARFVTGKSVSGYDLVRETWKDAPSFSTVTWEKWLFDGVASVSPAPAPASVDWAKAEPLITAGAAAKAAALEIGFALDATILDGRHANNGWLRELPHPMTKVTWENTLVVNKATANGLKNGDLVSLTVDGASVTLPLYVLPGLADGTALVSVGHGRKGLGRVADQHGTDTYPVLPVGGWYAEGSFSATGDHTKLANLQPSGNSQTPDAVDGYGPTASPETYFKNGKGNNPYEPRFLALTATAKDYLETPNFPDAIADRVFDSEKVKSWMYPERPGEKPLVGGATTDDVYLNGVHQWGMSIDLSVCTGCNACTVACQAENNIPVVGKEQVSKGREMHWIRLDRYFSGTEDDVEAIIQPLPCQQCETAPCEAVCPVKATAHSNEGLNDMAYNRCIGTRYCSNNCPFKVRRYNWFNLNLNLHPLEQMQKNPDVSIRFRGVMEKCTYCVQRINRAKIAAKIQGDGRVRDGAIVTACQQACPADAIVFGDLRDPESKVFKAKSEPRNYQLLRELNLRARTTYLAKIKNPNPDLV
jgi:molybdopterin-containing oxidoreductase family iron-sulfur binding subunit